MDNYITTENLAKFKENADKLYAAAAPNDGNTYVQQNGQWVAFAAQSNKDPLANYVLIQNQGWKNPGSTNPTSYSFDTINIGNESYSINAKNPSTLLLPKNGNATLTLQFDTTSSYNTHRIDGGKLTSSANGNLVFTLDSDKFSIITYWRRA